MQLVGTAVLRGCRRAPHPRHGWRLRVALIVHSGLVDRPGPDGRRRGRKVVCEGSGGPPYTKCVESQANHSWNYPKWLGPRILEVSIRKPNFEFSNRRIKPTDMSLSCSLVSLSLTHFLCACTDTRTV